MELETVQGWIEQLDYEVTREQPKLLRLRPKSAARSALPPFFVQCSEHWVMLSILPVLPGEHEAYDLPRRLLALNRDMRIAKFALGEHREVVLCAELPTESLDFAEVADAVERLVKYYFHYRDYLLSG